MDIFQGRKYERMKHCGTSTISAGEITQAFQCVAALRGNWKILRRGFEVSRSGRGQNLGIQPMTHRIHGAGIYSNIGEYIDGKCYHIYHTWILWVNDGYWGICLPSKHMDLI